MIHNIIGRSASNFPSDVLCRGLHGGRSVMEWNDEGVVISVRRHGEMAWVVDLLTAEHGRHAGFVHGKNKSRERNGLQLGNQVDARWRSRLIEQLGTYNCELIKARSAILFHDPIRLIAMSSVCGMCYLGISERVPCRDIFDGVIRFLDVLEQGKQWYSLYVTWELELLSQLGFGLDLKSCAITGRPDNLSYVSPRTGRAATREAAKPYSDRLMRLPQFMVDKKYSSPSFKDIIQGLTITGHFLERNLMQPQGRKFPRARLRLIEIMSSENPESENVSSK